MIHLTNFTSTISQATFTVSVDVRGDNFLLEDEPGRYTNDNSQKAIDSTDRSMEYVAGLNGKSVRFGGDA